MNEFELRELILNLTMKDYENNGDSDLGEECPLYKVYSQAYENYSTMFTEENENEVA